MRASEDSDLVWDLREENTGRPQQFDHFWEECRKYLEETAQTPVHKRRHDSLMHLASAMSVSNLHSQVSARLPKDAKRPSIKWLMLQFAPKDPTCARAMQYTGTLNVRFAIQSRQWRFSHQDDH